MNDDNRGKTPEAPKFSSKQEHLRWLKIPPTHNIIVLKRLLTLNVGEK